jgi:20S proteasome subunit beta 6
MISIMLYSRRFFPYYISNIVVGLDELGKGVVYSYDPVGHMEKHTYHASGSSCSLLQPLLDNQVGLKNLEVVEESRKAGMTKDAALQLVKDVFTSAAERDIYTGDGVFINVITKEGVVVEEFPLRKD